jgi:hypothetical protein
MNSFEVRASCRVGPDDDVVLRRHEGTIFMTPLPHSVPAPSGSAAMLPTPLGIEFLMRINGTTVATEVGVRHEACRRLLHMPV